LLWLFCKTKFVVNDEGHKNYILASIAAKWRTAKSRLFRKFYKWDLTLEENLRNYPRSIDPDDWAAFVQYKRKPKTMVIILIRLKNYENN
jgi:hypothetical protein